jgi:hypothetical protein
LFSITNTSQPAWIRKAFNDVIYRLPRIVELDWFRINKETDWALNTPAEFDAFHDGLANLRANILWDSKPRV